MLHDPDLVSIQEVRTKVQKAYDAWLKYRTFSQEQIDAIVERMAAAGRANARKLAEMAVSETGYGNVKDKIVKNLLNADILPRKIRGMKTIGYLRDVPEDKIVEYGVPMGVVAAILPTTNPTSTAIYKIIIALKAGNTIVLSPHPRARQCTCYTADLLYQAALEAGAPENVIQCVTTATIDSTNALMRHERTAVILSTGGSSIVRAAYSSGKPAFGVGPGNVPVLIERTADLSEAISKVVEGKSFDYGTVCSSEQTIVCEASTRDAVWAELKKNKAYIATADQAKTLGKLLMTPNWTVNAQCVGQSPQKIAQMAGFSIPEDASIIACEIGGIGKEHPLSAEKLSPVLSVLFVNDWNAQLDSCHGILRFGGMGHTCVIYSKDDAKIREFGARMPAFRVLVNTPSPQGSTGVSTSIFPAMTLGCGAIAGNVTSDNVGPQHLLNIKRLAYVVRRVDQAFSVPLDGSADAAPAPAAAGGGSVDRQTIAAAVEKYLASRGISVGGGPAPAASAPVSVNTGVVASVAAEVVERFLAQRGASPAPAPAPEKRSLG